MIALDGVGVRYGTACALDGVSEEVPAGQWLGIIGPNGAGKTTLLRSIACLAPHAGTITIDGQPVSGLRRRRLARLVAYVPQLPGLPPEMTVGDYVLLGRTPHIGYLRMETAADRQICAGLLDRLGLSPMAGRTLATLSGGELQRVVLARALAQEAPVLLLDEPTSALDLGRRVDALELIDELRRERSLTVLSAVHDLTLAGQFADRLLLLDQGRVAATGPPRPSVLRDDVLTPAVRPRHPRHDHGRHAGRRVPPPGRAVTALGSHPKAAADDLLHDLGRPAEDGLDPAVGERPGHAELTHVPVAAVQLQAAVDHAVAQLGVPPLDHGGFLVGEPPADVLHHRPVGERPRHGELGRHLGEDEPAVLEAADRAPERLPLLAVGQRVGEHLLRPRQRGGADRDPLPGQVLHQRDEAAALLAEQVGGRDGARR